MKYVKYFIKKNIQQSEIIYIIYTIVPNTYIYKMYKSLPRDMFKYLYIIYVIKHVN